MRRVEVVDAQEEADPASELTAHDLSLPIAVGACEQESGHATCGPNHDPPFGTAVVC
ncbi:hypothetical protein D3C83_190240 [compost metagenome]